MSIMQEDIENIEQAIHRWERFIESGHEALGHLRSARDAMNRATLAYAAATESKSENVGSSEKKQTRKADSSSKREPFSPKYKKPSKEYALELLRAAGEPMTAPEIQRALEKQGRKFSTQALTHGLRQLEKDDEVIRTKRKQRVTYRARNAR